MAQKVRPAGTEDAGIGEHDRVDFPHALHGVEEGDEEDERNGKRHLRPETEPKPQHEDRSQHDAGDRVHCFDEGIENPRHERAEAEPYAGGDTEEEAVGLTKVVPFLVEDELKRLGGSFSKAADWQPYVLTAGRLITGQNPASSGPAAKALLEALAKGG